MLGQRGRHLQSRSSSHAVHVRAAEITARKVREARDFLEVPIAVENASSYAEFHMSEMTEWEFLERGGRARGLRDLLDVNNIYVSSRNHDFDPYDYLNSIPAERVAKFTSRATRNFRNTSLTRTTIP